MKHNRARHYEITGATPLRQVTRQNPLEHIIYPFYKTCVVKGNAVVGSSTKFCRILHTAVVLRFVCNKNMGYAVVNKWIAIQMKCYTEYICLISLVKRNITVLLHTLMRVIQSPKTLPSALIPVFRGYA